MKDMSHDVHLDCPPEEAIERATAALAEQGFGVLTRIDLHEKFAEKLGADFRFFTILGACNPALAHTAVGSAPEIGLLLPCNVVVEDMGGSTRVRIIDAESMMAMGGFSDHPTIGPLGRDANAQLADVAEALAANG